MAQPNTCWSPPEATALRKEIVPLSANEEDRVNSALTKKADARSADTGLFALLRPTSEGPENERHFAALHFGLLVNDGDILQLAS